MALVAASKSNGQEVPRGLSDLGISITNGGGCQGGGGGGGGEGGGGSIMVKAGAST